MNKPDVTPNEISEHEPRMYRVGVDQIPADHFTTREFQCNDGTRILLLSTVLLKWLDVLRSEFGPIRVNSGFRTHAYNEEIGGADDSRHLYGMAADVVSTRNKPEDVVEWAEEHDFGGIGRYPRFTHLDVWSTDRRWDNR